MPKPKHQQENSRAEIDGKNTIYFVLFLESALLLYFIGLGAATFVLDHEQRIPLLLFTIHFVLFDKAFELLRKYRKGAMHKPINPDRGIENIGRSLGGCLVLVADVFSLTLTIVDQVDYHDFTVWVFTIVFWSLAALSTVGFIGVTIAYSEHQLHHLESKVKV